MQKNIFLKRYKFINSVYVPKVKINNYAKNFGHQWKDFSKTQIDYFNNTKISEKFIKKLLFNDYKNFRNKVVLEIGCGSGRFTQYLSKYSKILFINDLSDAIFFNYFRKRKNVIAVKDDFKFMTNLKIKFDIIICRGVLQHTPEPLISILQMSKLLKNNGVIYFDIYKPPKIIFLNSKYLWRNLIKLFNISYKDLYNFLIKYCASFLYIRRNLNKIFFMNLNFIWDYIFPIYDYNGKLPLSKKQLEEWAILDTLDGLLARYDRPFGYSAIKSFLEKNSLRIINYDSNLNCFKISRF